MAAACATDGSVSVWSLTKGQRIAGKAGLVGVQILEWTHDGKAIVTGGNDKVVRIWPLPAGEKAEFVASKELKGATGAITAVETGTDLLIAASADGKVRLWSVSEGKLVRELAISGVTALGLSGDGTRFAAGRADGVVQIWDLAASKPIVELSGDAETHAQMAALDWVVAAGRLEIAFQKQEVARIEAQNKGLDALLKKTNDTIATERKELIEKQRRSSMRQTRRRRHGKPWPQSQTGLPPPPLASLAPRWRNRGRTRRIGIQPQTWPRARRWRKSGLGRFISRMPRSKPRITRRRNHGTRARSPQPTQPLLRPRKHKTRPRRMRLLSGAAAARTVRPLAVRFSADMQTVAAASSDGSLRCWAVSSGLPVQHLSGCGPTAAACLVGCTDGVFAACARGWFNGLREHHVALGAGADAWR